MTYTKYILMSAMWPVSRLDLEDYEIVIGGHESTLQPGPRLEYNASFRNILSTNASKYELFTQVSLSRRQFEAGTGTFREVFRHKGFDDSEIDRLRSAVLSHIDDEAEKRQISLPNEVKERLAALLVLVGKSLDEQV
jgi:hypothetical protein